MKCSNIFRRIHDRWKRWKELNIGKLNIWCRPAMSYYKIYNPLQYAKRVLCFVFIDSLFCTWLKRRSPDAPSFKGAITFNSDLLEIDCRSSVMVFRSCFDDGDEIFWTYDSKYDSLFKLPVVLMWKVVAEDDQIFLCLLVAVDDVLKDIGNSLLSMFDWAVFLFFSCEVKVLQS